MLERLVTKRWLMVLAVIVGIIGLFIIAVFNPEDTSLYPRCPFYVLTGYKCPGCGTLRAIHRMLHLQFSAAFAYNPLLMFAIPYIVLISISSKIAKNHIVSRGVVIVVLLYWLGRNIVSI